MAKRGVQTYPAQGLPRVLERYLGGESVQVLAAEEAVSRQTIYNWLLGGLGDKAYHDVVTQALVKRISDADEKLEEAKDALEVAKAREMCRYARMDFERRRPGLYGAKQFHVSVAEVTVRDGTVGRAAELLRLVARKPAEETNTLTVPFTVVGGPEDEDDGPAAA